MSDEWGRRAQATVGIGDDTELALGGGLLSSPGRASSAPRPRLAAGAGAGAAGWFSETGLGESVPHQSVSASGPVSQAANFEPAVT